MFVWHLKEHLLQVWQTPHVGSLLKRPLSEDLIIPQDFQRGELENAQLEVVKLGYHVVSPRKEKFRS
jgi:hypothetical protein